MNSFMCSFMCLMAVASVASASLASWGEYKQMFGKNYTGREDSHRQRIFDHRVAAIARFNGQSSEYKMGLNPMSDWTDKERSNRNKLVLPTTDLENSEEAQKYLHQILDSNKPVPKEIDWSELVPQVASVQDQGKCGSDWAFSAVGTLEFMKKRPLSVQQIVDCAKTEYLDGCNGGDMFHVFNYIHLDDGISAADSYPYTGVEGECKLQRTNNVVSTQGAALIPSTDEETLKKVVGLVGPVAVGISASSYSFQDYESGIFNGPCDSFRSAIDHAVIIVGYGTDSNGQDYWKIKNSWGEQWGESGYMRITRGQGTCGLNKFAVIPVIDV